MMIYFFIFTILLLSSIIDIGNLLTKEKKTQLFWSLILMLILFKGLRWDTGTDWAQYYTCFERSSWTNIFSYARYGKGTTLMEPGYMFINILIKSILPYYTFFLLLTNAFILIIYGKVIQRFIPEYHIATLAIASVSLELFPVRQSITFAILCYAFKYVLSSDWKKYLLSVVICSLIHRSSAIYIIFYPLLRTEFKIYWNVAIYMLLILGTEIFGAVFDYLHNIDIINIATGGVMDTYDMTSSTMINMDEEKGGSNYFKTYISSIVQLLVFYFAFVKMKSYRLNLSPFFLFVYFKMKCHKFTLKPQFLLAYEKLKVHRLYLNPFFQLSLNAYFIVLCLNLIGKTPGFGSIFRLSNSLSISYALCVGFSIYFFSKNNLKLLAIMILLVSFCIKLNTLPILQPEQKGYELFVPYKSFLQDDKKVRSGKW